VGRTRARRGFILGSAAYATAIVKAPAKAAQFEFKCASIQPVSNPATVRMTQMWADVERESGGRIRTQLFPNGQLGGDAAVLEQLRGNAIQFYQLSITNLALVVPAADIAYLGFAFKDVDEALHSLDGPLGNYIRSESLAKGIPVLRGSWPNGMNQIGSAARQIKTVDDLHGFKIRVPVGRVTVDLFRTLGASPVSLSVADMYTSLQTKLIDGEGAALTVIEESRLYEVNKYIALANYGFACAWMIVNADAWKSLPPDLQAIVERNHAKASTLTQRDVRVTYSAVIDKLKRQGVTFNTVDQAPFRAQLRPYYTQYSNTFGSTAWGLLQNSVSQKLL
jgi:tripartite ATP-independent transporter DctP family solute receptor